MKYLFLLFLFSTVCLGQTDWHHSPVAPAIPFDNSTNGFVSDNVQEAIEELGSGVAVSASPGFTWGKSGSISNAWLLNDTVPSNVAGRIVPITSGYIAEIFVSAETVSTCTLTIYKRTDPGPVYTAITSVSLTAERIKVAASTASVARGDELAIKVTSGSIKNPVVGLVIKGEVSSSP